VRFRVQAVYRISELAEILGWERRRVIRLLDRYGVQKRWDGRGWLIPLSELNEKLFWLRASAEQRDVIEDSLEGRAPRKN